MREISSIIGAERSKLNEIKIRYFDMFLVAAIVYFGTILFLVWSFLMVPVTSPIRRPADFTIKAVDSVDKCIENLRTDRRLLETRAELCTW